MWKQNLRKIATASLAATVWFGGYNTVRAIDWDDANNTSADNNWSNTGNWNPDGSPSGQNVNIGNLPTAANDTTIVDLDFSISSLTLSGGADVDTNTNELLVNGATVVGGAGSTMLLRQSSNIAQQSLDTNTLTLDSGGTVQMFAGSVLEVDSGLLEINAGGALTGNGIVQLLDNPLAVTQLMENSGTLTATSNSPGDIFGSTAATLTINATSANARLDLDGDTETGVVNVNRADTLDINVPLDDPFGGTMNLGEGATLDISTAWSLSAGDININTGGIIVGFQGAAATIAGGAFTLGSGSINLDDIDRVVFDTTVTANGGAINNAGGITFNDTATIGAGTNFVMSGTSAAITVGAGKLVTINDADFNLDGAGTTTNFTTIGDGGELDINLNAAIVDMGYGHTITLNGGTLDVVNAGTADRWSISPSGVVNVNDAAATSRLQGDGLLIDGGDIVVNANADLRIETADVVFGNNASVSVAAGATFDLVNTAFFQGTGTSFTGAGTLVAANTNEVNLATTFNVATLDLDAGDWLFQAATIVNANNVETGGSNDVGNNQVFTIANTGSLTINLPNATDFWRLDSNGDLIYNGDAAIGTFLQGNDVEIDGDFDVNGQGRTTARLVNISSQVDIAAAGRLQLGGGNLTDVNTIAGGTINGPGTLGADTNHSLHGFGTINATIDFTGSADLRADNGELVVTGAINDARNVGTADVDGILNVVPAWNSAGVATVSLFGGELKGGQLTLGNALGLSGHGLVTAKLINNSRINASAGTLKVQTALNDNDWDGAGGVGVLSATNGALQLLDNANTNFSGTVSVTGGSITTDGFGFNHVVGSTVSLDNGTYVSTSQTVFNGAVNVAAGGGVMTIKPFATFAAGSNTTLTGNLRLDNTETRIAAGATFGGGGVLINDPNRFLNLQDGANVGVAIQNNGRLISTGDSQVTGLDYVQGATGNADFSLSGTNPVSDFDRLSLSGLAQLAGRLSVSLPFGYVPALGDTYQIISAPAGVSGEFTSYNIPVFDLTRSLAVKYNANNVTLQVIAGFWGDYNGNGEVDAADYTLYRDSLGQAVAPFTGADGSGNGVIDVADYNVWVANFGKINALSSVAAIAASSSAVPEPAGMVLVVGLVGLAALSRKQTGRKR